MKLNEYEVKRLDKDGEQEENTREKLESVWDIVQLFAMMILMRKKTFLLQLLLEDREIVVVKLLLLRLQFGDDLSPTLTQIRMRKKLFLEE